MKKFLKIIARLLLLVVLLYGLAIGGLYWMERSMDDRGGNGDVLVILGCQVYPDGSVSKQMEWRLEKAMEAYEEKNRPIVVCGGQGKDEPDAEANVMAAWLMEHGVPEEMISKDDTSTNTWTNLENALKLAPDAESFTIVTSDYHVPRAVTMARRLGMNADGIGGKILPRYWLKNHAREVLGWGKYVMSLIIPGFRY